MPGQHQHLQRTAWIPHLTIPYVEVTQWHQAVVGGLRDLWLVQLWDSHQACYLVDSKRCPKSGLGASHSVIEADNGMLHLIEKKLEYKVKMTVAIAGRRLTKGDFGVRIGFVTQTVTGAQGLVTPLGHTLEVEYMPVGYSDLAMPMVSQFLELLRIHMKPDCPSSLFTICLAPSPQLELARLLANQQLMWTTIQAAFLNWYPVHQ
ncbi:hypothetical protein V8C86DRAFT_3030777 [Haematococcus lacustris]